MALTTAGKDFIAAAVGNFSSPNHYNNANAHLGVGDSSAVFSAAHTDLQASTNKIRKSMETSFPDQSQGAGTIRLKSSYATGEANFDWEEWGTFNAASAGTMLNRKVESLGTKTSAQTWELTADLTFVAS